MVDQWGRPTMDDGLNLMRTAMAVKGFQNQQTEFAHKQKDWNDKELADKYFGMKQRGEDIPQGEGYSPKAELAADEMVNRKWQAGQVKNVRTAEEKLANMPDNEVLNFQPTNYAEHIVAVNRIDQIRQNTANRAQIDKLNNAKAIESYQYSMEAFKEARQKLAAGDSKGASDELVKIGMITNNPFKVKPSGDGKTVELYFTKDGVDQPGQKYTIDEAMGVAQNFLQSDEFFKAHLQNRMARQTLNEKYLKNPLILEKGKDRLRAVLQMDLNTNQAHWYLYDKNGKNPYEGKPVTDLGQLYSEGWSIYDAKTADIQRKNMELSLKVSKEKREQEKFNLEKAGKWKSGGGKATGKWRNDWWPQTTEEQEGGDPNVREARAIVARAYDTAQESETQRLIANQVMPEFRSWVNQNKDQMVKGPNGEKRPLNSSDLQSVFNHIAYDIIQRAKGPQAGGGKTPKAQPIQQNVPGMVEAGNLDIDNRSVAKNADGSISTELSFSIHTDKGEVLLPQIINGKKVSRQEAIDHYRQTGEHLGIFKDAKSADAYAEQLHRRQGKKYANQKQKKSSSPSYDTLDGIIDVPVDVGVDEESQPEAKKGKTRQPLQTTQEKIENQMKQEAAWRKTVPHKLDPFAEPTEEQVKAAQQEILDLAYKLSPKTVDWKLDSQPDIDYIAGLAKKAGGWAWERFANAMAIIMQGQKKARKGLPAYKNQ